MLVAIFINNHWRVYISRHCIVFTMLSERLYWYDVVKLWVKDPWVHTKHWSSFSGGGGGSTGFFLCISIPIREKKIYSSQSFYCRQPICWFTLLTGHILVRPFSFKCFWNHLNNSIQYPYANDIYLLCIHELNLPVIQFEKFSVL